MMDGELAEQFERRYEPSGRVLLACAVLLGWALGIAGAFPDSVTSRLFAFLAGGVLITSVHAEVRAEEGTAVLVVRWRSCRLRHHPDAHLIAPLTSTFEFGS